jgi:hypothetical protein
MKFYYLYVANALVISTTVYSTITDIIIERQLERGEYTVATSQKAS